MVLGIERSVGLYLINIHSLSVDMCDSILCFNWAIGHWSSQLYEGNRDAPGHRRYPSHHLLHPGRLPIDYHPLQQLAKYMKIGQKPFIFVSELFIYFYYQCL